MLQTVALAAIAAAVAAAPLADTQTSQKVGFTIDQIGTGRTALNGPAMYQAALLKHKAPVPPTVAKAAANFQVGSVAANPQPFDSEYLSPVSVGTPAQNFNLQFDTGSSDFWVFSTLQPAASSKGHAIYNPSSSSTSRQLPGETWNITDEDGSGAKGVIFSDKVVIGGVTATSQAVEAATSVSSDLSADTASDGIAGFAFDSDNTATPVKVKTWFSNVAPTLPTPIFASYLHKGQPGAYDFGFINTSRFVGPLTFTNVSGASGVWLFKSTGYSVGSTQFSANLNLIADTGTTLVLLSDAIIQNYYSRVPGAKNSQAAGGWIFPCQTSLPSFSVLVSGVPKTIPGSYIKTAPVDNTYCFGGLQSNQGLPVGILGDVFLKSQYAVFDISVPRIGFAAQCDQ